MFRKEFQDVITKTGMVPLKDLRPLLMDKDPNVISELGLTAFLNFLMMLNLPSKLQNQMVLLLSI